MQLRTDPLVVEFIDADAVQVVSQKNRVLTMDQVLIEIEKDEFYDLQNQPKHEDTINHKEFLTWKEFLSYFEDYKEIAHRNKAKTVTQMAKKETSRKKVEDIDPEAELKSLLQQEKERRLKELPQLRPADQIDISEEQLLAIKQVFDKECIGDIVNSITFFFAVRKSSQLKRLSTTLARDPEGTSRLQKETFQQVFDRMEKDQANKQFTWATIVEYFTKRGRPLTKEEIRDMIDEDRRLREEAEESRRLFEDQENRRMQRLKDELEQEEDYEAYQMRMKQQDESDGQDKTKESSDEDTPDSQKGKSHSRRFKSVGVETMPTRLSTADYAGDQDGRKGRYGVTVPKPFQFDIREQVRPKTIREQKVERMINEKQQEEDDHLNQTFRSKPIPANVLKPQYERIIAANE